MLVDITVYSLDILAFGIYSIFYFNLRKNYQLQRKIMQANFAEFFALYLKLRPEHNIETPCILKSINLEQYVGVTIHLQ